MARSPIIVFSAGVIKGVGRGKTLGSPTINLDLNEIPDELQQGIYACYAISEDDLGQSRQPAVMHYGPRPVFDDTVSCEVHVLDESIPSPPKRMTIIVIEYLREITDFPLREVLQEQIKADILLARDILIAPENHS